MAGRLATLAAEPPAPRPASRLSLVQGGLGAPAEPGSPDAHAGEPEPEPSGEKLPGPAATRARALVVEDQAVIALELEDMLADRGLDVVGTAYSADEAVALVEALRPDLVTMDINLGTGRDGISAATEIYQRFGIRSIFVSAYANAETQARAAAARPIGWITKPISGSLLDAVIDLALGKRG